MSKQVEIDQNFSYFMGKLSELAAQSGRFALIRHQEIIGFFDTPADAVGAGNTQFKDGLFSIQQVTDVPANLGYYSHAVHLGSPQ